MTVTQSTTSAVIRSVLVVSLLGAALLIGSARPGAADEIMPTPVSATQAQDAGQSAPAPASLPMSVGAAGFGWG
jgi:hypothetical protein